jgi:spore germination protein GerM
MKKKKRAAPSTLGFLFWAALFVVLAAVALAVRAPVLANVRKVLGLATQEVPVSSREPAAASTTQPPATRPSSQTPAATTPPAASTPAAAPSTTPAASQPVTSTTASTAPRASAPAAARPRTARLWFSKVDDEGAIEPAPVTRSLPASDSPLRDNLAALLAGPTAAERAGGIVSLLPAGTVVRSVTVKGDTATIDFSEQFRFNELGIEGLRAQLRQVVWVATEFPTVNRVQVLIEGKRVDYLAPEGAAVGTPLARDSDFQ